jgi:hypothetical protein
MGRLHGEPMLNTQTALVNKYTNNDKEEHAMYLVFLETGANYLQDPDASKYLLHILLAQRASGRSFFPRTEGR